MIFFKLLRSVQMLMNNSPLAKSVFVFLLTALIPIGMGNLWADSVKLKSGQVWEGKITFETNDVVKIQVPVSASINETKTILRSDIEEIVKASPDDVAMEELKKLVPTPSLLKPSDYQNLIDAKVQPFLNSFAGSKHKPAVEKILEELKTEKDKVERGQIKLENEWIDAKTQQEFKTRTDARILDLLMRREADQRNLLGALRRFETLEEQYFGTPAFLEAVPVALKILPAYGQALTQALQNVEYLNQKWEQDKGLLNEVERARVEAARQRELDQYKKNVEAEKAKAIKWQTVNPTSKEDLQANVNLVRAEITRLQGLDLAALTEQSKKLVEADELIAKGDLEKAKTIIAEVGGSLKKSGSSSKTSSKKGVPSSSYVKALADKIVATEAAMAAADAASKITEKGKQTAGLIQVADAAGKEKSGEEGAEGDPSGEAESGAAGAMAELMATHKSGEEKKDAGKEKSSKGEKPKAKRASRPKSTAASGWRMTRRTAKPRSPVPSPLEDDEEGGETAKPRPDSDAGSEGGGMSFQTIIMIVAGLLVVVTVAMKALGVGSAKGG